MKLKGSNELFARCKMLFKKLSVTEWAAIHNAASDQEGPIHIGRHPKTRAVIMCFYEYPFELRQDYFALYIPGLPTEVHVYSYPPGFGYDHSIKTRGGTRDDVLVFIQSVAASL